jgi:hypothetical protein
LKERLINQLLDCGGSIGCGGGCSGDWVASWICFITINSPSRKNVRCPLVKRRTVRLPGGASCVARVTVSNCSVMMPIGVPSGAVNTSNTSALLTLVSLLRALIRVFLSALVLPKQQSRGH